MLVGFSTHHGTVTCASDWGGPADFMLLLRGNDRLAGALEAARLQRAIGVIYLPETERMSHYFHTRLMEQFDAMIHFDATHALEPLEPGAGWIREEVPETYPTGI